MFDTLVPRYDLLNHLMSGGHDLLWRRRTAASLPAGCRCVLDLGTGTGDLAITVLQRTDAAVIGLDLSMPMLELATTKVRKLGVSDRISMAQGDVLALPFANDRFDATTIAFGLRNVADRSAALREMARVVRPGGKVLVLEMTLPRRTLARSFFRLYLRSVIPTMGRLLSPAPDSYRYLPASIRAFPSPEELTELMCGVGLTEVRNRPMSLGITNLHEGTVA